MPERFPTPPSPGFLSLKHAAQWAGVSPKTMERWIEKGLPKYQAEPGSKVLIRPNDIEIFLTKRIATSANINTLVDEVLGNLNFHQNEKLALSPKRR